MTITHWKIGGDTDHEPTNDDDDWLRFSEHQPREPHPKLLKVEDLREYGVPIPARSSRRPGCE